MASVKTITLPDGSSYDFKATYDIEGNNISETYINKNEKGAASGVAPLNFSGTIDKNYLPTSDFVSESGSLVQFDYSKADVPFSSLKVKINAVQLGSGDPSPTNIREIIGYDSASAIVTGKNMAPQFVSGRSVSGVNGNNSGTASDGTSVNCATEEFIPVNLNASWYTYGYDSDYSLPATPSSQVFCYDADKNYLGYIVSSTSKARNISMASQHGGGTFDNSEVCYVKIRYFFASGNGHTWTQAMCDGAHFRMNPGNTLNDYVAHEAPDIYTVKTDPIYGVCEGTINITNGTITVNKVVYKYSDFVSYDKSSNSSFDEYYFRTTNVIKPKNSADDNDLICSHAVFGTTTGVNYPQCRVLSSQPRILFPLGEMSTKAAFTTWLETQNSAGTPLQFSYAIEPVTYNLIGEPEELEYTISDTGAFVHSQTGELGTSSITNATSYIDVSSYDYIAYKQRGSSSSSAVSSGIAFYDSSQKYISGIRDSYGYAANHYLEKLNIAYVPSNAVYVRCSTYMDTNTYGEFEIHGGMFLHPEVTTLLGQNNVWSDAGDVEVAILPTEISNYIKGLALVVSQDSTSGELTLS